MCKHGTTAPMPINGRVCDIDSCIAHLVAALNAGGILTRACCCGHGNIPPSVILADDRWLILLPRDEAEAFYARIGKNIHGETKVSEVTHSTQPLPSVPPPPPALNVEAIRARLEAATPGPWRTVTNLPRGPWHDRDSIPLASDGMPVLSRNWKEACLNAHFIAHAPSDIHALLDAVEALHSRIQNAKLNLDGGNDCFDSLEEAVDATKRQVRSLRSQLAEARADTERAKQRWHSSAVQLNAHALDASLSGNNGLYENLMALSRQHHVHAGDIPNVEHGNEVMVEVTVPADLSVGP